MFPLLSTSIYILFPLGLIPFLPSFLFFIHIIMFSNCLSFPSCSSSPPRRLPPRFHEGLMRFCPSLLLFAGIIFPWDFFPSTPEDGRAARRAERTDQKEGKDIGREGKKGGSRKGERKREEGSAQVGWSSSDYNLDIHWIIGKNFTSF